MRFIRTVENLFGLPLGFTRVEYLQSSGTQYIDTGIIGNGEFDVDYLYYQTQDTANAIFAGTRSSSQHLNFGQRSNGSGGGFSMAYLGEYWQAISSPAINTKIRVQISYKSGSQTGYLNGVSMTGKTLVGTEETNLSIYVFKRHHYGTDNVSGLVGRIYYFKLWKDGTLVRDFIPCIDSLGVPCMYDMVDKKPYYNQGTGTFTVGRQVIPVEYLESTGTQYIDTSIAPNYNTKIETVISGINDNSYPNGVSWFFGSRTSNQVNGFGVFYNKNEQKFYSAFGNIQTSINLSKTNIYDQLDLFVIDNSGSYLNGTKQITFNSADFTGTYPIYLYTVNLAGALGYLTACKIHYCKIYNNNTLVRDFIPCKDENNVGFMFDTISGTVYLNAGTGTFSVGENKYTSKLRLIKDAKELPDGYKRVEYLESVGGQLIDTGYNINTATDEVICNFQLTSTTLYQWLMGEHDNNARFGIGVGDGSNKRNIAYGVTTYKVNDTQVYNNRHVFTANSNGVYLDGVQVHGFESFTSTSTIYLFNLNISGGGNGAAGKIWSYKHKRNGILIRDFVPCIDPQGVPCMVDLVSGGTYYNQGTGSFNYGHIITPVEYLESTGTQYINTEIKLNSNSKVDLMYEPISNISTNGHIFGARDVAGAGEGFGIGVISSKYVFDYKGRITANSLIIDNTTKYRIIKDKTNNKIYVDGNEVFSQNNTTQTFTLTNSSYLFRMNDAGTSSASSKYGRIYYCQIWDNNILVRDFIPVKDENNVGYMFDKVTHTLYANAGTGSFVIGNDLPKPKVRFIQDVLPREYRPLKYLASTGTQYIDTGVILSSTDKVEALAEYTGKPSSGSSYIFGAFGSSKNFGINADLQNSGNFYGVWYNQGTITASTPKPEFDTRYKVEVSSNGIYINDTLFSNVSGTFTGSNPAYLFWANGTSQPKSIMRLYYARIWNNGIPVRDFYPALRKSDNKPGMYDRITKQFFVNQGTGEFNYEV